MAYILSDFELMNNTDDNLNCSLLLFNKSFFEVMQQIMALGNFFGLMPKLKFSGIDHTMKFGLRVLGLIYSLIVICAFSFVEICAIYHLFSINISRDTKDVMKGIGEDIVGPLINTFILITYFLYMRLGFNWPKLMRDWRKIDCHGNVACEKEIRILFLAWSVISIGGFIFNVLTSYGFCRRNRTKCERMENDNFLQDYAQITHPFMFSSLVTYSNIFGLAILIFSLLGRFVIVYQDLFVMAMSIGLANRYKEFNRKLDASRKWTTETMQKLRYERIELTSLTQKLDASINGIVFCSLMRNLFLVGTKLIYFTANWNDIDNVAIILSGTYDLATDFIRMMAVISCGMQINDRSRACLPHLYSLCCEAYNADAS